MKIRVMTIQVMIIQVKKNNLSENKYNLESHKNW